MSEHRDIDLEIWINYVGRRKNVSIILEGRTLYDGHFYPKELRNIIGNTIIDILKEMMEE